MDKDLLYKYFRGETSPEEELSIIDWTEESEDNYKEFLRERRLYDMLLMSGLNNRKELHRKSRIISLFSHYYKYAAVVVGAALLITSLLYINRQEDRLITLADITEPVLMVDESEHINLKEKSFTIDQKNTSIKNDNIVNQLSLKNNNIEEGTNDKVLSNRLLVPHGQTYTVVLSDSTVVILNAESELVFPSRFSDVREVKLKGEAYFQVAHNDKPFIVHADDVDVRVLGTKFNVSNYSAESVMKTTLVEGSVQLEYGGETKRIKPSEQFSFNKENKSAEVCVVDTDIYTSWINDEYIFRNNTLDEILAKIGHWYKFDVSYEDETLKNKRFSFTIGRDASLDRIIEFVNSTEVVRIERINNSINIKNW